MKNRWNDLIPIIYIPVPSIYDIRGRNIITRKKNAVRSSIDMIIPRSDTRCIKYPATKDAFTEEDYVK